MAEQDESGERTELPSEKRLREAREQGNVPRSRELATAAVFGVGVVAVLGMASALGQGARVWMRQALTLDLHVIRQPEQWWGYVGLLMVQLLWVVLPVIALCLLAGFIGPVLMGGLRFSGKALMPEASRLNPLAGLKRLYGPESLAELLTSLLRVLLVGVAAGLSLILGADPLRALLHLPLEQAVHSGLGLVGNLVLACAGALALLAAVDAPYQRWNWMRKLKMTRQQVREELKESEGRPEVKGRLRQLQQQFSQRRMIEQVPGADVIVVNPSHYAVALKYQAGQMGAPRVVAKGLDEVALRIRQVAQAHRIAIVSAPPLARALYREGQLGQEIPVRLYTAVAQILSYVYQLRAWRDGRVSEYPDLPPLKVDEGAAHE